MTDKTPINTNVPISIHPDVLTQQEKLAEISGPKAKGTIGPKALQAGKEALGTLYRTLSAIDTAEKALNAAAAPGKRRQHPDGRSDYLGDLRLNATGRVQRFADRDEEFRAAVQQAFERVALTTDRREKELGDYLTALDTKIEGALTDPRARMPDALALAGETRAHVKALQDGERFGFVHAAISQGDLATVSAVINAPPFLSGLKPEEVAQLRIAAAQKFAPLETAQRQAVATIAERVRGAAQAMSAKYGEVMRRRKSPTALATEAVANINKKEG